MYLYYRDVQYTARFATTKDTKKDTQTLYTSTLPWFPIGRLPRDDLLSSRAVRGVLLPSTSQILRVIHHPLVSGPVRVLRRQMIRFVV